MHNRAMAAALAAEAAGKQNKFWEYHDAMFKAGPRALSDENLDKFADEVGLDVAKWKKDKADKALEAKIKKQQSQGATLGARGTPAFFINGRFLSGAQPVEAFKKVIDEEMKKANALEKKGVPKAQIYAKTIEKGLTKP